MCCVRVPDEDHPGRRLQEVMAYSTLTRSLLSMADHLASLGVTRVVMEATADYWKPVFYLLEAAGFQTWLVNAKDVKHLPGRPKTDKCAWPGGHPGGMKCSPRLTGRGRRIQSGALESPRQVWRRARGTWDCRYEHEPQLRLLPGPPWWVVTAAQRGGEMELIYQRVAGLDVHRDEVAACVRTAGPRGGVHAEKARFSTTTGGLAVLAGWLAEREVTLVAMEATGVYWKPVYYALEDRFELWLCNAHHVKNVPGRKTDMSDAEWLADVAAHGMVRPSFVPPPAVRELRVLTRYRQKQTSIRAGEIARLEKVLQDAGIKLTSVASKVLTQSGRAMIEALIAGERDPRALAGLAKGKLRPKIPQLTAALDGHFGAHHAVAAARILAHLDFLDTTIAELDTQIAGRVAAGYQSAARLLREVPGIDRASAEVIIAETGADMSRFPSPAHLAAWAGLCPGNHESAGKRRMVATRPGNPWLRRSLIESARAAARTKGSYFGAQYRQIARRRGPNKAAVAVAHSLLDVAWHLLTTGELFADLGEDYFLSRHDKQHQTRRLISQLEKLGYTVELSPAA